MGPQGDDQGAPTAPSAPPGADGERAEPAAADDRLAVLLADEKVPIAVLRERYGPLLALVDGLLGVVPQCDPYLEIWPPAFRAYNLIVPNLLDLPFAFLGVGKAPRELVGLGMYVSSRTAECAYCSAHSCSFALRRGVAQRALTHVLGPDRVDALTARELATAEVARALAAAPLELRAEQRDELEARLSPAEAEWVVMAIAMMGFLNKFMNAVGVELERPVYADSVSLLGADWTPGVNDAQLRPPPPPRRPPRRDSLWTRARVVPYFPAALRLDRRWQRGVPDRWPAVGSYLRERTGHDFPVLAQLRARRCIRAIATVLRDSLDPRTTVVGLEAKVRAGVVFAAVVGDPALAREVRVLGAHNGLTVAQLDAAQRFALGDDPAAPAAGLARATLRLARAASPSPAQITPQIVAECRGSGLAPAAVVELVAWLAVLQMLHRLSGYYAGADRPTAAT